jgi:prepilin-type N-terminal cleavage/methylation domain-containing protein/prepilin-type processing-associated H-X9-DG protein
MGTTRWPIGRDCRRLSARRGRVAAFTLVEMLVVVAVIALLVQIVLPSIRRSIRQAQSTVCQSNLHDLYLALRMYADEYRGSLPIPAPGGGDRAAVSWADKLFETNPAGATTLICPSDPWATILRRNLGVPGSASGGSASYGLNDFVLSSPERRLTNLDRPQPRRPGDTILLADLGPDTWGVIEGPGTGPVLRGPSRYFGRLVVDDGYQPGAASGEQTTPWLTGRHSGRINVLTWDGGLRAVAVGVALERQVAAYYPLCAAQSCPLCLELELPHYSFAEAGTFWWTGSVAAR